MMSEYSDIVKQGYLKTRSKNLGHWQKKWVILRRASSKGANRLERFSDEKASHLSSECKVIQLCDVDRVERMRVDNRMYVLVLWFSSGDSKKLAAGSDMDATDWQDCLTNHIGTSSLNHGQNTPVTPFDMSTTDPMFHVYLLPNTSTDFNGEYLIQVTSESIILRDVDNNQIPLVTWRLNTLRRYGRDESKFTFESGRSSQTGEGLFIFTTVECERIYQRIHSSTQALVTVQNMTRRQKDGIIPEGTILPALQPLSRHHSDTSTLARTTNDDTSHELSSRNSNSLPPTPNRAPLPIPRSASNALAAADNNDNTKYIYSEAKGYGLSRPLPPPPGGDIYDATRVEGTNDAEDLDYIYEEKGLSDNFRRFLKERKEDDLL